ncbi:hypothetical protein NC99_40800 [Sunxiuqinia dokdonensis]|uniref:Uncharacterized protein n=1 Tax=Sunxiuqinia dokdonensis TaxID=1409788 RepID=A0A0L8V3W7_9BACT|nr:hypothetical protein NC99_40800 [Sunxiuqinia dokdonensis]
MHENLVNQFSDLTKYLKKRTTHQVCMGKLAADVRNLNTVFS